MKKTVGLFFALAIVANVNAGVELEIKNNSGVMVTVKSAKGEKQLGNRRKMTLPLEEGRFNVTVTGGGAGNQLVVSGKSESKKIIANAQLVPAEGKKTTLSKVEQKILPNKNYELELKIDGAQFEKSKMGMDEKGTPFA